ncbi:MAG: phosphate/phosphite/phosphonate ABC transporter substrate-binding protein [Asticcacaulis sp.]
MRLNIKTKVTALAMAGLFILAVAGCSKKPESDAAAPRTEISFAVLSVEQSQNLSKFWAPLFADMEKQTGLKVKPFYSNSYTAMIEAMRFNQIQAGWFSNVPGLEAMRRAEGEVFVRTTYANGRDGYNSLIIVPATSTLTLDKLLACDKTLNFGMGDVKSTSGTLAPLAFLFLPHNIDPNTCFKTVRSASHQANFEAVSAGIVDAATNNSTALDEISQTQPDKLKKVKILWTSPLLPNDVMEYRKDLDPVTKEKLRSFFLTYGTGTGPEADREREILKNLQWGPLKPDDNSHFLTVRMMEASAELQMARNKKDEAGIKAAQAKMAEVAAEQAEKASPQAPVGMAASSMPNS